MQLFSTNNLKQAFPEKPVLQEFIRVVEEYYLCYAPEPAVRKVEFAQLFAEYEQLSGKQLSPALHELVRQEQHDLSNGNILENLNKVFFNCFDAKEYNTEKLEFHTHTYDIHIVFRNHETYIFALQPVGKDKYIDEFDAYNDTQFVTDVDHVKTLHLDPTEGMIIPPGIPHFSNFRNESTKLDKKNYKCVVKVDKRYAELLQLV